MSLSYEARCVFSLFSMKYKGSRLLNYVKHFSIRHLNLVPDHSITGLGSIIPVPEWLQHRHFFHSHFFRLDLLTLVRMALLAPLCRMANTFECPCSASP